jgi:uncharacterized membrane protein
MGLGGGVHREILPVLMILLMFAIAAFSEPRVQANSEGQIISHWNFDGKANGWINKTVGVYLLPAITLFFYLFFMLIPRLDVYKKNLKHFSEHFWGFKVVFVFVMMAIFVATLLPNLGYYQFDPLLILLPAVALIFFYVGHMLSFTKRNYFIGVRTPWTLASEEVWEKTNKLASKLFWVAGVLIFVTLIAPSDMRLWIVLLPLVLIVIGTYVYSLLEYKKIMRGEKSPGKGKKKGKK